MLIVDHSNQVQCVAEQVMSQAPRNVIGSLLERKVVMRD